jgi:hypothetical protein
VTAPKLEGREQHMPLHISKFERLENAGRNDLALAALEACRAARTVPGVNDSRFYWADPNAVAIVTDAEPGAWGPGSGNQPDERNARAVFARLSLRWRTWRDKRRPKHGTMRALAKSCTSPAKPE